MKRIGIRLAAVVILAVGLVGAATSPAVADDHGHDRYHHHYYDHDRHHDHGHFFLGLNFGAPAYYHWGWHRWYRDDDYYWPRRYYYYEASPPVVYVPVPRTQGPTCRTFHGNATIDATGQPFYGTACFESDGRWHIAG